MSARRWLRWLLPFVVSAAILAWLLTRYDLGEVLARVGTEQTARLLPVLGALLWLVPLLWPRSQPAATPDVAAVSTSSAILYMFGVWTFLALMALFLSVMLDANAEANGFHGPVLTETV